MIRYLIVLILTAISIPGQQLGNPSHNYTINGSGSGLASVVNSTVSVNTSVANAYATLDANAPVAWVASTTSTIGWYLSPWNSVDIGPAPLLFLGNGADPLDPFAPLFRTNASGSLTFSVPVPSSLGNTAYFFAMAHQGPSSPEGFWVSQTHLVTFTPDPNLSPGTPAANLAAQPLALTDDSFTQVPLGFSFPFFGTSHSIVFVGSNGYVTFGTGDTNLYGSSSYFLTSYPRIAAWWDDLNPGVGGTVRFHSDNSATAEVTYTSVPEFGTANANTFKITLIAGMLVILDYGPIAAQGGFVGLSPGSSLAPGLPLNFSQGFHAIGPGLQAPYEMFSGACDLVGYQVNFLLDASGTPIAQI